MKRGLLVFLLAVPVVSVVTAQLVITSFNNSGDFTWTNSVSNATYRVEWAGSAAGPWQKFDALTNLTLLSATSNAVTVKVPTFYRVIWLDAPAHAGTWNYSGFASNGGLVVTGLFSLSVETNPIRGTWDFKSVDGTQMPGGHPTGRGLIREYITQASFVVLDLYPGLGVRVFPVGRRTDE